MSNAYAILPCNGLDKAAGSVAREVGLRLSEGQENTLICPVLCQTVAQRYAKDSETLPAIVIDGCATRCASRLAAERGFKVAKKSVITDEVKRAGVILGDSLRLEVHLEPFISGIIERLTAEGIDKGEHSHQSSFDDPVEYTTHVKDKFIFRVPTKEFLFNENDCWVRISGNRARIGVTDFVQQSLSDIIFLTLPAIGAEIEQFGEIGAVESSKAVFELVSPVSGKVVAVNQDAEANPECINENPYELGWIAEVELTNLEEDKELLLDSEQYMKVLKKKVDEFHV